MGKKTNNGFTVSDMEKYAPTTWGAGANSDDEPYDYTTASGQLCLIRRIGMADILSMGLLDTLDFFGKALSAGESAPGKPAEEGNFLKLLSGNFDKMQETIDKVLLNGVVAPVLHEKPAPGRDRDNGKVYVDQIPFPDRVELFSEILDTEGLSQFRGEPETGVGLVPNGESVQASAE